MNNIIRNILYKLLKIQESYLKRRLAGTIGVKSSSLKKRHFSNGCVIDLSTLAENEKVKLEDEINLLLKRFDYEPTKLLEYIKSQGTNVIYLDNAAKYLNSIGENEGFILPSSGAKALYLSVLTKQKLSFKTNEMFILSKGKINKYYFIYHFYNWFALKHNIAGLEPEAQNLLKKYLFEGSDVKTLQLSEIYKLKDAIRQDKASIEFVIKLCRNFEGSKQAIDKLKNGGANL